MREDRASPTDWTAPAPGVKPCHGVARGNREGASGRRGEGARGAPPPSRPPAACRPPRREPPTRRLPMARPGPRPRATAATAASGGAGVDPPRRRFSPRCPTLCRGSVVLADAPRAPLRAVACRSSGTTHRGKRRHDAPHLRRRPRRNAGARSLATGPLPRATAATAASGGAGVDPPRRRFSPPAPPLVAVPPTPPLTRPSKFRVAGPRGWDRTPRAR